MPDESKTCPGSQGTKLRIAVCQYLPSQSLDKSLSYVFKAIEESSRAEADLITFGEWFLGISAHKNADEILNKIAQHCRKYRINAVTGNMPIINKAGYIEQRTAVIDSMGRTVSLQKKINPYHMEIETISPGHSVLEIEISIGRLVVLNGLDAIDPYILHELEKMDINLLVLQINPSSSLEAESLKELALALSTNCSDAVIVPSQGALRPESGGAFVAYEGIILEEGYNKSDIIIASVLSESFIGFRSLREQLLIPDLLRQKFQSELNGWQKIA